MNYFFTIFLSLIITGCATSGKINGVQIGMTKEDAINIMGDPVSISAKGDTEYLNYKLSETDDDAFLGWTSPYYIRLINGKVESYGRTGDFDSTHKNTIQIKTDKNVETQGSSDLYTELRKLKELRDEGVLTEDEYQIQKKRVLSK
ncbi:SHOCT domain-containing protein [Idiomarina abyssalis]|uniref:SHOCT domain-containing protein n=1 Tax=Idiomarina abyssalis TaxID=86102 RepID=UPI003A939FC0